jgi:hypothetical protein
MAGCAGLVSEVPITGAAKVRWDINLGHVPTCTRVPKSRILPVVMRDKASVAIGMFGRCR